MMLLDVFLYVICEGQRIAGFSWSYRCRANDRDHFPLLMQDDRRRTYTPIVHRPTTARRDSESLDIEAPVEAPHASRIDELSRRCIMVLPPAIHCAIVAATTVTRLRGIP
jgi:hypothetical protein